MQSKIALFITLFISGLSVFGQSIDFTDTLQLASQVSFEANGGLPSSVYEWHLDNELLSETGPSLALPVNQKGTFRISVLEHSAGGCVGLAASCAIVVVDAKPSPTSSIKVYAYLSPNGDGHNDTWQIDRSDLLDDCVITVYNRYGQEVFRSQGYKVEWDGKQDGKALPTGEYYYLIKGSIVQKGVLVIMNQ